MFLRASRSRMTLCLAAAALAVGIGFAASAAEESPQNQVERWGIFELTLEGPASGNPYQDVTLRARFRQGNRTFEPEGFYDGDGAYRVRFMPDAPGRWTYTTQSNCKELGGKQGGFTCVEPSPENHGPVRVHNTYYFAYADGTPYFQIGTTCYAWAHQGDRLEEQTLATLRKAPFNKLRMCVFPKSYSYNQNEPPYYPFPRKDGRNDYSRFNPAFFQHFEKRVGQLRDLGIEADLIIFHPYDRWGYKSMDRKTDDRYLRYLVARLAAYRNVWWSLANEFDLMLKIPSKKMEDWDRFFQIVQRADPYGRLRSIHNCRQWYDHTKPWVTHASIQSADFSNTDELRKKYRKPLVFDECRYEGNIPQGWGNISARQMTHHFWLGTIGGCYVGHGETYKHPQDILWWSKGGVLHGQGPARIAMLKKIMQPTPFDQMTPKRLESGNQILSKPGELYFVYFSNPVTTPVKLTGDRPYKVDLIDTWSMTVDAMGTASPGELNVTPPGPNYLLRFSVYAPGEKLRPDAKASAEPTTGTVPLTVQFSTPSKLACHWEFGDGTESNQRNPVHTYKKAGLYTATLTVTDEDGATATRPLMIAVDRPVGEPIIRVGFEQGNNSGIRLHGDIRRADDGTYDLGDQAPWRWISVGDTRIEALEGLQSLTIMGWLKASKLEIGPGGNRIAFNLAYNRAGFDLVSQRNGSLRLAVNQWPDQIINDSSPGKIRPGKWIFFAVTYDATRATDNVGWYFGDVDTPATLDRTTTYRTGPTDQGSGPLTIGNYNATIHRHGQDRQFRGQMRAIQIFGSRIGSSGALGLEAIRRRQHDR